MALETGGYFAVTRLSDDAALIGMAKFNKELEELFEAIMNLPPDLLDQLCDPSIDKAGALLGGLLSWSWGADFNRIPSLKHLATPFDSTLRAQAGPLEFMRLRIKVFGTPDSLNDAMIANVHSDAGHCSTFTGNAFAAALMGDVDLGSAIHLQTKAICLKYGTDVASNVIVVNFGIEFTWFQGYKADAAEILALDDGKIWNGSVDALIEGNPWKGMIPDLSVASMARAMSVGARLCDRSTPEAAALPVMGPDEAVAGLEGHETCNQNHTTEGSEPLVSGALPEAKAVRRGAGAPGAFRS